MSIIERNATSSASNGTKKVITADHEILSWKKMRNYFENQQLFDVVFIAGVDQKRVPAHRLVLSVCSPYFSAMFTGSLREATEKEITLNEVHGNILQTLVEFCYTGCIELRQDTVEMILMTASLLQLNSVVTECTYYLEDHLDASNSLGIGFLAELYDCKKLQKKAEAYTRKEFAQVCKSDEFLNLSATQVAELISRDDLNVPSEEIVFNSVMEWVDSCDLSKRNQHIRELLPLVRMTQLLPSFIENHVKAVCRSNDCLHLLNEALEWHRMPDKEREAKVREYPQERNSTEETLFAVGSDMNDKKILIDSYCPRTDAWTFWNYINGGRYDFSVATIEHNLYIVGGRNEYRMDRSLNSVINMNLTTLAVKRIKPMNTRRARLCVAVVGNSIYAIGGEDNSGSLNTVERWNSEQSTWSYVAPMSTHRWGAGAAVLNGCIYVVGGCGPGLHRSVECYNPRYNTWTDCAPMSTARHSFGVAASEGFLYAVGGIVDGGGGVCGFESSAERYDPVADKWTMIESMSMDRSRFGCTFLGNCLMAVGGHGSGSVEEYNPETGQWRKTGDLQRSFVYCPENSCVVPTRYLSKVTDAAVIFDY